MDDDEPSEILSEIERVADAAHRAELAKGQSGTPAATSLDGVAYSPRLPPWVQPRDARHPSGNRALAAPAWQENRLLAALSLAQEETAGESESVAKIALNKHVRGVAIATAVAILLASAFPPFQYRWGNYVTNLGYSFLFSPARLNDSAATVGSVNLDTLFIEYVGILAIGVLAWLLQAWVQYALGLMCQSGYGATQDYAQAVRWFRKAAEQGNAPAQHKLGFSYYNGRGVTQDHTAAFRLLRPFADQSDPVAQFTVGLMYFKGQGAPQDYATALRLLRPVADQGNAIAQFNVGLMYFKGQGALQCHAEALKWLRKAADQNFGAAQWVLGTIYSGRNGSAPDYVEAHKWYSLAAAHMPTSPAGVKGRTEALRDRDAVATKMTSAQIAEAEKLARA